MRSLRLKMIAASVRPILRWRMQRLEDPLKMRRMLERASKFVFRAPPHAMYVPSRHTAEGLRDGLWVSAGRLTSNKVILYLHGGGYMAGSPYAYRKLVAHLCHATGMRAFVPGYRLVPEDPLPASFDDAMAAYEHLLEFGYAPEDIVIGGDSAGGGLTFALLSVLCARGTPPAAAFGWSSCLDLTYTGASITENAKRDHVFPGERVHDFSKMILGELAADDPRVSPLFAEFPDCPPVLLQVADSEILRDDSTRMEAKLRGAGVDVRLETWENAPHVWHLMCGYLPEAQQAVDNTATFIKQHLR